MQPPLPLPLPIQTPKPLRTLDRKETQHESKWTIEYVGPDKLRVVCNETLTRSEALRLQGQIERLAITL